MRRSFVRDGRTGNGSTAQPRTGLEQMGWARGQLRRAVPPTDREMTDVAAANLDELQAEASYAGGEIKRLQTGVTDKEVAKLSARDEGGAIPPKVALRRWG